MNTLFTLRKYPGRTFDLAVMHGGAESGETPITLSLFHGGGAVCTGIQKLIQRFFILLTTPVGSMTYAPARGCSFLQSASRSRTEQAVQIAFRFAVAAIKSQLTAEETENQPADEKFSAAELTDVSFFGDTLSIAVSVTSQAGTSREVILPVYV